MTLRFVVEGMTCQRCVARVKAAASTVAGVASVEVNVAAGTVALEAERAVADSIAAAITAAGYPARVSATA
jgi:copper chaperone